MRRGVRHQVQRHGPVLGAPAPRGRLPHLPGEWPAGGTRACEPPSLSAGALPREERPHSSTPRLVPGLLVLVGRSCHYSASLRVSRPPGLCRMWSGVGVLFQPQDWKDSWLQMTAESLRAAGAAERPGPESSLHLFPVQRGNDGTGDTSR